jgi:hypothetical protein
MDMVIAGLPHQWSVDLGYHAGYSHSVQVATALLLLAFEVILAPLVDVRWPTRRR